MPSRNEFARARERLQLETPISDDEACSNCKTKLWNISVKQNAATPPRQVNWYRL
jgi:hypothetical protein